MPKKKTHKGLAKRFRVTGTGKVMRRKGGKRHLQSGKTAKRRRHLSKTVEVTKAFAKKIRHAISS